MAVLRVFGTNALQADGVTEAGGDACRPGLELGARPFKAMIAVTEPAFGKRGKDCVVFGVRSGEDDVCGLGELKEVALEGGEPCCVEMLDDFHDSGSVEAVQTRVPIDE